MKYILMMNTPERGPYSIFNWPRKDLEAHVAYWKSLNTKLFFEQRETEVTALFAATAAALALVSGMLSMLWFNRIL